jgi:hypothetical protein
MREEFNELNVPDGHYLKLQKIPEIFILMNLLNLFQKLNSLYPIEI